MQDTDGSRNADVFIDERRDQRRDTDVVSQMSLRHRRGLVNDYVALMEQPFYNIHRVLGRIEMLFQFA